MPLTKNTVHNDSSLSLESQVNKKFKSAYRNSINGLRAIAVTSVILFHSGLGVIPGGYVGVDIFFVISGYLITGIIYQEIQTGSFSWKNFYERRSRRIFPALLLVITVSLPFAWLILLPGDMKEFYKSIAFTTIFSPNIFFYRQSGYFDTQIELKPLVHAWSLGVEEQFYFVFPLLLVAAHKWCKKYIFSLMVFGAVISLLICQNQITYDDRAAFYLLPGRFWELLIGSLISVGLYQKKIILKSNILLSLVGIFLIFYSFFGYDSATIFPGFAAIPPTLGTALILLYAPDKSLIGAILSNRYLAFIGLISYSAYLWHQPIFAFAKLSSLTPLNSQQIVFAIICVFSLAAVSYLFIELPFRNKIVISTKFFSITLAIGFSILLIFSYFGRVTNGFENRYAGFQLDKEEFSKQKLKTHCKQVQTDANFSLCITGSLNENIKPDTAIFGDSHANALVSEAGQYFEGKNRKLVVSTLDACPPLLGLDVVLGNYAKGVCRSANQKRVEYIKRNPEIRKIYLVARWALYTNETVKPSNKKYYLINDKHHEISMSESLKVFKESLSETIYEYENIGVKVILLLQPPEQKISPDLVYSRMRNNKNSSPQEKAQYIEKYSIEKSDHFDIQSKNREIINAFESNEAIQIVNFDTLFCTENKCLFGDESHSLYRDNNHFNKFGARKIVTELFK